VKLLLPEQATRFHIVTALREQLGNLEETEHLIDYIQDAWETFDLLLERFGRENTLKIITTPSCIADIILLGER
jgi:hypothetical protein